MIVAMLIGGSFFSFIIGAFVGVISSLSKHDTATSEMLDSVNEFISAASLKPELATRLRAYFRHQHGALSTLATWRELLDGMSPALRGDVAFAVNANWIRRLSLFAKAPPSLLIELSLAFRPMSFPPGEVLLSRGDDATVGSIVVITRGVVRCCSPDRAERLHFAERHRSTVLGVEALFPGARIAATVVSIGPVRAQTLRMDALQLLVRAFPAFQPVLRRMAMRQCLRWRMLGLVSAVHRVKAALAAATAAGCRQPCLSELMAAAARREEPELVRATDGDADRRDDDVMPSELALFAVALASPAAHARAAAAALTLQRFWRGHWARRLHARVFARQRSRQSMRFALESRRGTSTVRSSFASDDGFSVAENGWQAHGAGGGGGGGVTHKVVMATMMQEFAALRSLLQQAQHAAARGAAGVCGCGCRCGGAALSLAERRSAATVVPRCDSALASP